MDFDKYCKDKIDIGVFNLKLSEDEFVKNCKRCFGIGGMSASEFDIRHGFGKTDFSFKVEENGEMVTKFDGSWAELYHLLLQKTGKEDKQLTLW